MRCPSRNNQGKGAFVKLRRIMNSEILIDWGNDIQRALDDIHQNGLTEAEDSTYWALHKLQTFIYKVAFAKTVNECVDVMQNFSAKWRNYISPINGICTLGEVWHNKLDTVHSLTKSEVAKQVIKEHKHSIGAWLDGVETTSLSHI